MSKKENETSSISDETFKEVSKCISDDNKTLFIFYVSNLGNIKAKRYNITFDTEMVFH